MRKLSGVRSILLSFVLAFYAFFSFALIGYAGDLPVTDSPGGPNKPAEGSTLLPQTESTMSDCEKIMLYINYSTVGGIAPIKKADAGEEEEYKGESKTVVEIFAKREEVDVPTVGKIKYTDIMACAIMTGDVKLWMLPFIIRYMLEFVIGLAGLLSVGGIVYGGYLYLFAGIGDDKDKGKNAIKNSLIGLVLTLTAWGIVNIVIALVTF